MNCTYSSFYTNTYDNPLFKIFKILLFSHPYTLSIFLIYSIFSIFSFYFDSFLHFYSKERNRGAEITHSEHLLKDYAVQLGRISPYGINTQPLVNLQVLFYSMFVQLLFYPQKQCRHWVQQ